MHIDLLLYLPFTLSTLYVLGEQITLYSEEAVFESLQSASWLQVPKEKGLKVLNNWDRRVNAIG